MAKIYGYYEYDNDSLTPGQAKEGGWSQLLFDDEGRLSDHASFHPADNGMGDEFFSDDFGVPAKDSGLFEDVDDDAVLVLVVLVASAGGIVLVRKVAPHVHRMLKDRTIPVVRDFWDRVRGKRKLSQQALNGVLVAAEVPRPPEVSFQGHPTVTDVSIPMPRMSREEWFASFRTMFEAQRFADEQWKILASARVEDDELIRQMQGVLARNEVGELMRRAALVLESPRREEQFAVERSPQADFASGARTAAEKI